MPCPDEDTFARFVEGLLPPAAAAEIERHVDGCARCADLAAEFGSLYAEPAPAARHPERLGMWALLGAAVLHAAWALVGRAWPGALDVLPPTPIVTGYALYAAIWAPLGCAVALVAALGLARGQAWGRAVALAHAALSLPSVILTPLAIFVIAVVRRRDNSTKYAS